jgi:hypothetical protein
MILDCDRLWSQLVTGVYRLRRKPRVVITPPAISEPPGHVRA